MKIIGNREKNMQCVICKTGQIQKDFANVVLQRGNSTIVIKDVLADICDTCGEYYLSDEMTELLLSKAEKAVENGAEIEVMKFAA